MPGANNFKQEFGELKGKVEAWMESDRAQHVTLFSHIEKITNHISNIEVNLSEVKTNIDILRDKVLSILHKGFWDRFFAFAQTPKGGIAIVIAIIVLSAFYIGVDKIITVLEILVKTR